MDFIEASEDGPLDDQDVQQVAARACAQARVLKHQADLAADLAIQQALTLLLDRGASQREAAKLTGVSKSSVSRAAATRPPRGVGVAPGADTSVYAFAERWIWGRSETAAAVHAALDQSPRTPRS